MTEKTTLARALRAALQAGTEAAAKADIAVKPLERFTPYLDRGWGVVTKAVMTQTPLGNWVRLEDHLACIAASLSQLQQRIAEVEAERDEWRAKWKEADTEACNGRIVAGRRSDQMRDAAAVLNATVARAEAAEAALAASEAKLAGVEAERDQVIRTSAAYNATEREATAIMEGAAAIERAEAAEAELAAALLRIQELEDPRVAAANERGRQAVARRSVDNG